MNTFGRVVRGRRLRCGVAVLCGGLAAGFGGCAGPFHHRGVNGMDEAVFGKAGDDPLQRAAHLVARLTLDEKVAQLQNEAPAISRLGIPAYDWWSESLHGVARNGPATVFPQAIGLAASFDEELVRRVARAIADEARAKFDEARARDEGSGRYEGLTFFAPNVNIFRDPRWGRGQETYGEDPHLTARLGVAYVRGLQGDDPRVLRAAAVAKHFAVHSGPELTRHRFDARVDAHDLADTYLPQFEAIVRETKVAGIMAAYNRLNGEPCVASPKLLGQLLRRQWGFAGFVVGDCGAIQDLVTGHGVAADGAHAAALALRAGTDLDCGRNFGQLGAAVRAGLIREAELDQAVARLFAVRFRLGLFEPAGTPAGDGRGEAGGGGTIAPGAAAHLALAREAAQKSLVLLENEGVLPLSAGIRRLAVVGPLGDDEEVLLGNYHGTPIAPVTLLAGIRAAARTRGITVNHAQGVPLVGRSLAGLPEALAAAASADVIVATLGLSPRLEGEEGDPDSANPAGDRQDLNLPAAQTALLVALLRTGKPTVVVLTGGSALNLGLPPSVPRPRAVVMAWYPGEQGGHAVADLLFGDIAPTGRLPVTFYRSAKDLPPFSDYAMAGRTYRYFAGKPLYPFGYGLRFTPVAYSDLRVVRTRGAVTVTVENQSDRAVDEVVQIYATARVRQPADPLRSLIAFQRVPLSPRQKLNVDVALSAHAFTRVAANGDREQATGEWELTAGDTTTTLRLSLPPITVRPW